MKDATPVQRHNACVPRRAGRDAGARSVRARTRAASAARRAPRGDRRPATLRRSSHGPVVLKQRAYGASARASALASSVRDRTPSFRYARERCISTVLTLRIGSRRSPCSPGPAQPSRQRTAKSPREIARDNNWSRTIRERAIPGPAGPFARRRYTGTYGRPRYPAQQSRTPRRARTSRGLRKVAGDRGETQNDRQGPQERLGHAGGREATHTGEPPSNETTRILVIRHRLKLLRSMRRIAAKRQRARSGRVDRAAPSYRTRSRWCRLSREAVKA
jgi:hypothetical protein